MTVRVALAQVLPVWEDPEANLTLVGRYATRARDAGAALVAFPEQALLGWNPTSSKGAEDLDGDLVHSLMGCARDHRIGLVGSIRERVKGGTRNTAIAFDSGGRTVAAYAKRHLFTPGGEEQAYLPGDRPAVFECEGMRFGIAICYDLRFPEDFAGYRALRADAVLVLAAWPHERLRHWRLFLRARALDNRLYVAGVSYARGTTPFGTYSGGSAVADPDGEVCAAGGEEEGLIVVDLDPDRIAAARQGPDPAHGRAED